jgi:DNA (cytosine-5)-methyltransferase 1
MPPLKFVDLCAGIGSFHHSLAAEGLECVMACDIDPAARKTYAANYGIEPLGDLYDIDPAAVPAFDVCCAGFPCQPFSNAGHHLGFDDTRGVLFFQIMKLVNHHKPKYLFFENVPALLSHDGGRTFAVITHTMQEAGYEVAYSKVTCSDYGIPQMRKRVLLVGVRGGDPASLLDFQRFEVETTMSEYLGKPFEKKVAYTIRCGGRGSPYGNKHNWDGYVVDGVHTRLTLEDGLRLQGFPAGFELVGSVSDKWKQLGNTIPTVFTRMLAKNLTRAQPAPPPPGAQIPA